MTTVVTALDLRRILTPFAQALADVPTLGTPLVECHPGVVPLRSISLTVAHDATDEQLALAAAHLRGEVIASGMNRGVRHPSLSAVPVGMVMIAPLHCCQPRAVAQYNARTGSVSVVVDVLLTYVPDGDALV